MEMNLTECLCEDGKQEAEEESGNLVTLILDQFWLFRLKWFPSAIEAWTDPGAALSHWFSSLVKTHFIYFILFIFLLKNFDDMKYI